MLVPRRAAEWMKRKQRDAKNEFMGPRVYLGAIMKHFRPLPVARQLIIWPDIISHHAPWIFVHRMMWDKAVWEAGEA